MCLSRIPAVAVCAVLLLATTAARAESLVLETSAVRLEVGTAGRNVALLDRTTGENLLRDPGSTPFNTLQKNGITYESSSVQQEGEHWRVGFAEAGVEAVLLPVEADGYLTFEVVELKGEGVQQYHFLHLPLRQDRPSTSPACTALALNLQTLVQELPGPMTTPMAACTARFGFTGAKAALVAAPSEQFREVLKTVVAAAPDLPHSPLGGPWALDAEINRGSYLIDSEGQVGEDSIDGWIALSKNLGVKQLDFHTGKSLRFGDLEPNPERYPKGLDGVKAVVDKLHAADLSAGLHTYAFFFARDSRWVSPVPDKRLAVAATFTLAADLPGDAVEIPVVESTANVSLITGFQVRNSVTLRIGDELVVFSGVTAAAPFTFTGCQRGAHGTRAAAHPAGAKVEQLKECFGLFVPDPESTLFEEVAARTAEVYNACGFDMIYLDALDGSDILAGGENAWYYAAKFVFALNKRLARPALFEMSTMGHHLWMLRSRMGAWDVPARGARRLVDIHMRANQDSARVFMPTNLGWWGVFDWNAVQPERTFPEDVEYLCAKALGYDSSLSLLVGFTPEAWERSASLRRLGGIIKQYEDLRLARALPADTLRQLQTPGVEQTLVQNKQGEWRPVPLERNEHLILEESSREWTVRNSFAAQHPRIRIECLGGLAGDDHPESIPLTAGLPGEFGETSAAEGVSFDLAAAAEWTPGNLPALALTAANTGAPRTSAWAMTRKVFEEPLSLYNRGLGLWVHGDGQGAILNVQLRTAEEFAGGRSEHYVDLDFTGWKYFPLVEPESRRLGEFGWPYSRRHADWGAAVPFVEVLHDFIHWVNYGHIESVALALNNLPQGRTVQCLVGGVNAIPVVSNKIEGPRLELGGQTVTFPLSLNSGEYAELDATGRLTAFGPLGEPLADTAITGELPTLVTGANTLRYQAAPGETARVRVTIFTRGE